MINKDSVIKDYREAYDKLGAKYKLVLIKLELLGNKLTEMQDMISKTLSEVIEL